MFQNLMTCRASLTGVARSPQSRKSFGYGSRENSLTRSLSPTFSSTAKDISFRFYSNPARKPGFFSQFVENIKQDMQKNKEMKESLKKFREEAEKLEQSEALRSARQKFQTVESEASKGSEVLKEKLGSLKEKVFNPIFLYNKKLFNTFLNFIPIFPYSVRPRKQPDAIS